MHIDHIVRFNEDLSSLKPRVADTIAKMESDIDRLRRFASLLDQMAATETTGTFASADTDLPAFLARGVGKAITPEA